MKINVTVDLSEFYSEEEGMSFTDEIKSYIAWQVKHDVLKDFKDRIGDEFNKAVVAEIETQKKQLITDTLNALITEAKVKKQYRTDELITIKQWMIESFERDHLNSNRVNEALNKQTQRSAENIAETLKNRHDILFATNIVKNLSEKGFLKENVAKTLLESNE